MTDWLLPIMILALTLLIWYRFKRLDARLDRLELELSGRFKLINWPK